MFGMLFYEYYFNTLILRCKNTCFLSRYSCAYFYSNINIFVIIIIIIIINC